MCDLLIKFLFDLHNLCLLYCEWMQQLQNVCYIADQHLNVFSCDLPHYFSSNPIIFWLKFYWNLNFYRAILHRHFYQVMFFIIFGLMYIVFLNLYNIRKKHLINLIFISCDFNVTLKTPKTPEKNSWSPRRSRGKQFS